MLEKLKVRTGMLLVLFCFVTALALACRLGWINAQRSVAEIEDLNNVAVHQVDPLYEANGALLRTRLALDATISELQSGSADQAAIFLQTANSQLQMARERYARYMAVPKTERGQQLAQTLQARFSEYAAALDAQYSALKENAVPRYQEGQRKLRQIDEGFTKDMQAFLGRVAERSDAVLDSSQRTYASADFGHRPAVHRPAAGRVVLGLHPPRRAAAAAGSRHALRPHRGRRPDQSGGNPFQQ